MKVNHEGEGVEKRLVARHACAKLAETQPTLAKICVADAIA
jgi:hypothetical protein